MRFHGSPRLFRRRHPGVRTTVTRPAARHDGPVAYRERATSVPGAVLWRSTIAPAPKRAPSLPDGCLDVLWDGSRLFVAGPDSRARSPRAGRDDAGAAAARARLVRS
jgi:hypothetical protein